MQKTWVQKNQELNVSLIKYDPVAHCNLTETRYVGPSGVRPFGTDKFGFLGLGVQPPTPSWGNIIQDGFSSLSNAWWISAWPGVLIVLTVMSFNVIADALKETINPDKVR